MTSKSDWRAKAILRGRASTDAALLLAVVRQQVRDEMADEPRVEAPATPRKRLWAALNSPLTLLLLSSVVLTGISQHFAHTQAEAIERTERRASFFKLFTELAYRLNRLQLDEDELADLAPDAARDMRRIGAHARAVLTGIATDGQSQPEFARIYTGVIVNQAELAAGLPNNRELEPVLDELMIDDCETAVALHGEMNVLRRWIALREPLVDAGKLPKLPSQVLSQQDQSLLVMPDFDALRSTGDKRWRQVEPKLEAMRSRCEDASASVSGAA